MKIEALRILPPFAIARLGSGAPLDSYRIEVDEDAPLDWRTIVPTTTFEIDPTTGAISREFIPDEIEFTEDVNGVVKIRKVAPFLELWAVTDDDQLVPVTIDLLTANGATPSDLAWDVDVGNRKVERRTGDAGDAVTASVTGISDHVEHRLQGTSPNFVAGDDDRLRRGALHPTDRGPPADPVPLHARRRADLRQHQHRAEREGAPRLGAGQHHSRPACVRQHEGSGQGELVPLVDPRRPRWRRGPLVERQVPQRDVPAVAVRDRAAGPAVAQRQRRSQPRVSRRRLRRNRRGQPDAERPHADCGVARSPPGRRRSCPTRCSCAAWRTISNRPSRARASPPPSRRR